MGDRCGITQDDATSLEPGNPGLYGGPGQVSCRASATVDWRASRRNSDQDGVGIPVKLKSGKRLSRVAEADAVRCRRTASLDRPAELVESREERTRPITPLCRRLT